MCPIIYEYVDETGWGHIIPNPQEDVDGFYQMMSNPDYYSVNHIDKENVIIQPKVCPYCHNISYDLGIDETCECGRLHIKGDKEGEGFSFTNYNCLLPIKRNYFIYNMNKYEEYKEYEKMLFKDYTRNIEFKPDSVLNLHLTQYSALVIEFVETVFIKPNQNPYYNDLRLGGVPIKDIVPTELSPDDFSHQLECVVCSANKLLQSGEVK